MNQTRNRILGLLTIAPVFVLCFCAKRIEDNNTVINSKDTTVVLFNIGHLNRIKLAQAISAISRCKPKVIGIQTIFDGLTSYPDDTTLAASIKHSGNIVLLERLEKNSYPIKSHENFKQGILGEGVIRYGVDDGDVVTDFVALTEDENGQEISFPYLLAFSYDPKASKPFWNKMKVNELYPIHYTKTINQFLMLGFNEIKELKKNDLEGKIVLMGYLGPGDESNYLTPFDKDSELSTKTYSSVIVANIVLDILNQK